MLYFEKNHLGVNRWNDTQLGSDKGRSFCKNPKGSESRFIFHCDRYADTRSKNVSRHAPKIEAAILSYLFSNEGMCKTKSVGIYVHYSLELLSISRDENQKREINLE